MLAGVSGVGGPLCAGRDAADQRAGSEAVRHHDRRLVAAVREGLGDLAFARGERQDQIGLAVLEQVGGLAGAVVGVDRHAADADGVQRQLVQDVLGPVLEQRGDAVAEAVAGAAVSGGQLRNALAGVAVGDFEAGGEIAAALVRRDGE